MQNFSLANGQLQCFVCTGCPHANELDYTFSQPCEGFTSPNTQTTPTITPTTTVTDDNGLTTNTQPFPTTTPIITGSPPNTPPTATITPTITVTETPLNAIRTNSSHEDKTKQPTRLLHILSQSQLAEIHLCYRIERIGENYI